MFEVTLSKTFMIFTPGNQDSAISKAQQQFKELYKENPIQEMDYSTKVINDVYPPEGQVVFRK